MDIRLDILSILPVFKNYILLIRIHHWIKNLLVFFPLIFSEKFFIPEAFCNVFKACLCFCFISSSVYIFNDIIDRKCDAAHPFKKNRPIAAGMISSQGAVVIGIFLLIASITISLGIAIQLSFILFGYFLLIIIYSIFLRNRPILAAIYIAVGFMLRMWAGAVVIGVIPSLWFQSWLFFSMLYLAVSKKNFELYILKHKFPGSIVTKNMIKRYDYKLAKLTRLILIICALSSYVFFAVSIKLRLPAFAYSIFFVIYGFYRLDILLTTIKSNVTDSILVLIKDPGILLISFCYLCFLFYSSSP